MKGKQLTPTDVAPHVDFFWQRVNKGERCWTWTGKLRSKRYGEVVRPGLSIAAHRFAWVLHSGQALSGDDTIDHRCRNTLCVNPDHLDAVSLAENNARTRGIYARAPKPYTSTKGVTTWRVRWKKWAADGTRTETSTTFTTESEARAWVAANAYRPLERAS